MSNVVQLEKKRILFIINGLTKNNGKVGVSGGDVRLFEIAKNLYKDDSYQIEVLTTDNGEELFESMSIPYHKMYVIPYSISPGIISNLIISLKSLFQLPKEVQNFNGIAYSAAEHIYDVLPALRLKLFNKARFVQVYHWVEEYPWKDKRGDTPFLRRYIYWFQRWVSGLLIKMFADEILAVSEQTRDKLIKIKSINPNRIKAVFCGVNVDQINGIIDINQKERGKVYDGVYLKRLNHGKGVFDLLKIWKKVCEIKKDAKLAIIGDGSADVVASIKKYITENGLEDNINLLGVIYDTETKFRILNSAKVFVLPSHEENWAIVIGEAMASKLPVVAYDLKEIHPIWKEHVLWIPLGNIEMFSVKILELLKDDKGREIRADAAHDFVKQYDWSIIAKNEISV